MGKYRRKVPWRTDFAEVAEAVARLGEVRLRFADRQKMIRLRFQFNEWKKFVLEEMPGEGDRLWLGQIGTRAEGQPGAGAEIELVFYSTEFRPPVPELDQALREFRELREKEQVEGPRLHPAKVEVREAQPVEEEDSDQARERKRLRLLGYTEEEIDKEQEQEGAS